jgi:hypothetical protein
MIKQPNNIMENIMAFNSNPINEAELIHVVGEWAKYNFGYKRAPHIGVIEEIGEAAHCVLKQIQGIRGFDDMNVFMEKFGDALADGMIYLADWCSEHNTYFQFGRGQGAVPITVDDQNKIITHLLQATAMITLQADREPAERYDLKVVQESEFNMAAQRICTGFEMWAQVYGLDLRMLVAHTWAKVSQRDWVKNPGGPSAELA